MLSFHQVQLGCGMTNKTRAFYNLVRLATAATIITIVMLMSLTPKSDRMKQRRYDDEMTDDVTTYARDIEPTTMESSAERFRMTEIRRKCDERQIAPLSVTSERFKYGSAVDVMFCEMPKVASTTWQVLLLKLNGFDEEFTEELLTKFAYDTFPLKTLGKLSEEEAWNILRTYKTLMITRHPFERLVSAHSSKFTNRSHMTSYRKNVGVGVAFSQAKEHLHGISVVMVSAMSEEMLRRVDQFKRLNPQQQNDVIRYQHVIRTGEISFPQFIKFILKHSNNPNELDIHWRPQVLVCQPCSFNYSMVMRFEHLVRESNRFLEIVQRGSKTTEVEFPEGSQPKVQQQETAEAFRLLSETQVAQLRELYKDDFYILDHDPYRYSGNAQLN